MELTLERAATAAGLAGIASVSLLIGAALGLYARASQRVIAAVMAFGSGALIQALQQRGLIDEYLLLIHPLLLGAGTRLFPYGVPIAPLRLINSVTTTKGVVIATYQPA